MKLEFSAANTADVEKLISLDRAKLAAKITGTERDEEVRDALLAAVDRVQQWLSRPLFPQEVGVTVENFDGFVALPFVPTSVASATINGKKVEPSQYSVSFRTILLDATGVAEFKVTAGYPFGGMPTAIKQALLMLTTDMLRNQQLQLEVELFENPAVYNLLSLYRCRSFL